MGRQKKVSLSFKGRTWYARFYDYEGNKRFVSLKTSHEHIAERYQLQLEGLQSDERNYCDDRVYEIFFLKKRIQQPSEAISDDVLYQVASYQKEITELKARIDELEEIETRYNAIMREEWARRINSLQNLPKEKEIKEKYFDKIKSLDRQGGPYKSSIARLQKFDNKPLVEFEAPEIQEYLEEYSEGGESFNKRWNKERNRLFHFYNFLYMKYKLQNPVDFVETKRKDTDYDIHWHDVEEVELAANAQDKYWSLVIKTMAYSGLSAHELRGLRKDDFYLKDDEYIFRVRKHQDRNTKNWKRVRNVKVHKERLLPLIQEHLNNLDDTDHLFPSSVNGGIWNAGTFTRRLSERTPKDMNALSLRRTFGSLLIRSGKTEVEVAAAMGNSAAMVRRYYARILGHEIDIDF